MDHQKSAALNHPPPAHNMSGNAQHPSAHPMGVGQPAPPRPMQPGPGAYMAPIPRPAHTGSPSPMQVKAAQGGGLGTAFPKGTHPGGSSSPKPSLNSAGNQDKNLGNVGPPKSSTPPGSLPGNVSGTNIQSMKSSAIPPLIPTANPKSIHSNMQPPMYQQMFQQQRQYMPHNFQNQQQLNASQMQMGQMQLQQHLPPQMQAQHQYNFNVQSKTPPPQNSMPVASKPDPVLSKGPTPPIPGLISINKQPPSATQPLQPSVPPKPFEAKSLISSSLVTSDTVPKPLPSANTVTTQSIPNSTPSHIPQVPKVSEPAKSASPQVSITPKSAGDAPKPEPIKPLDGSSNTVTITAKQNQPMSQPQERKSYEALKHLNDPSKQNSVGALPSHNGVSVSKPVPPKPVVSNVQSVSVEPPANVEIKPLPPKLNAPISHVSPVPSAVGSSKPSQLPIIPPKVSPSKPSPPISSLKSSTPSLSQTSTKAPQSPIPTATLPPKPTPNSQASFPTKSFSQGMSPKPMAVPQAKISSQAFQKTSSSPSSNIKAPIAPSSTTKVAPTLPSKPVLSTPLSTPKALDKEIPAPSVTEKAASIEASKSLANPEQKPKLSQDTSSVTKSKPEQTDKQAIVQPGKNVCNQSEKSGPTEKSTVPAIKQPEKLVSATSKGISQSSKPVALPEKTNIPVEKKVVLSEKVGITTDKFTDTISPTEKPSTQVDKSVVSASQPTAAATLPDKSVTPAEKTNPVATEKSTPAAIVSTQRPKRPIAEKVPRTPPAKRVKKSAPAAAAVAAAAADDDEEPTSEGSSDESYPSTKRRTVRKKRKSSETPSEGDRKGKRLRAPANIYQSPLPEFSQRLPKELRVPKTPQEKLVIFFKNEHVALRNAEGTFYICQIAQNVYKSTRKIKIRWLSPIDEKNKDCDLYKADYYDVTDFDCILTSVSMSRVPGGNQRLPAEEQKRILNILERALKRDQDGTVNKEEVDEHHPDGLDLSLYNDESQLKKRNRKGKATSSDSESEEEGEEDAKEHDGDLEEDDEPDPEDEVSSEEEPPAKKRATPAASRGRGRGGRTPRVNNAPTPKAAPKKESTTTATPKAAPAAAAETPKTATTAALSTKTVAAAAKTAPKTVAATPKSAVAQKAAAAEKQKPVATVEKSEVAPVEKAKAVPTPKAARGGRKGAASARKSPVKEKTPVEESPVSEEPEPEPEAKLAPTPRGAVRRGRQAKTPASTAAAATPKSTRRGRK